MDSIIDTSTTSLLTGVMKTQFVFNILGYSIYLSLLTCLVLATIVRFLPLTDYKGLLPRVNEHIYWLGIFSIFSVSLSFKALCNIALYDPNDWPVNGPKLAWKFTLIIYLVTLLLSWVVLPYTLLSLGVSVKYYLLDFLIVPIGFLTAEYLSSVIRRRDVYGKVNNTNTVVATGAEMNQVSFRSVLKSLFTILVLLVATLIYPAVVIPLYRSTNDKWRLLFVCGVHPFVQELTMATVRFGRFKSQESGEIVPGASKRAAFRLQIIVYFTEFYYVLNRRVMLSWMQNKKLILLGILVTAIEEAILRVTLTQRDRMLKRYMKKGKQLREYNEVQKTIWTASICHSMVAEHVAILVRWALVLLLPTHRYVFDLGYEDDLSTYAETTTANETIVFAFFVEWISEIIIDRIAVGVEFSAGVPLEDFFSNLRKSFYMTGSHLFGTLTATMLCLWTFTSMPSVLFCSEPGNMCACVPSAFPMYASILKNCTTNGTVVLQEKYNASRSEELGQMSEDNVDYTSVVYVMVAIAIFLAVGALASQANAWSKQKQDKRIMGEHITSKEYELAKAERIMKKQTNELNNLKKHHFRLKASVTELESVDAVFRGFEKERGVLHICMNDLSFESKLGVGNFGTVILATWNGKENVAVKLMDRAKLDKESLEKIKSEIRILGQINHPNIVRFIGASWDSPPKLCIVLEYVDGGDLRKHLGLVKHRSGIDIEMCGIALGVAKGLEHMHHGLVSNHKSCLIHRDVKAKVAKLADLGEARFYNKKEESEGNSGGAQTMTLVGTPYYLAPEIIRGDKYNEKVDVYSFGIMLNEMDTKVIPYESNYIQVKGFHRMAIASLQRPLRMV